MSYINGAELESCLLSQSTISSLISLLPTAEYDLLVRDMTVSGVDVRNPVGVKPLFASRRFVLLRETQTSV